MNKLHLNHNLYTTESNFMGEPSSIQKSGNSDLMAEIKKPYPNNLMHSNTSEKKMKYFNWSEMVSEVKDDDYYFGNDECDMNESRKKSNNQLKTSSSSIYKNSKLY